MDSYNPSSPQRHPLCTSFAPNAHDDVWRGLMSDSDTGSIFGSSDGGFGFSSSSSSSGGDSSPWFIPPGLHPPLVLPPPPTIRGIFRPPSFFNLDEELESSIALEADPNGIDEDEILRSLQEFRNSLPQIRRANLLGDHHANYTSNSNNSSNGNGTHNPQGRVFRKVRLRRSLDMQKLRPKYRKSRHAKKATKSAVPQMSSPMSMSMSMPESASSGSSSNGGSGGGKIKDRGPRKRPRWIGSSRRP
ncbi:hypothetical protein EX30DRAFT_346284 [Ascodesmis nigricans]|uniref:Uncharacterized protein n=1 Tax=Ascodesmis nigricans TaxID=341454 RepID=A0A4S2N2X7_9PEZI|nr:hypothetical protein EX30DRAFT_346284 [Ascodesmis nigricans]